jgi:methionyl-tRNA formyltransferase
MKLILWIGNEPNQKALANKISEKFPVAAIVTESRQRINKIKIKELPSKIIEKVFLSSISKAWYGLMAYYNKQFPTYPSVPMLNVKNINSDEALDFSLKFKPDLVIVSGTRLIRKKLFAIKPSIGILNLHTGLSPYIKGGPNCTNWCLSNREFHLIGNTIMWLDEGIDTGNLVATEFTEFTGDESLSEVHIKVMEHAHNLYLRSIEQIIEGGRTNIPQKELAKGKTYYTKQWGLKEKIKVVKNFKYFKQYYASGFLKEDRKNIKTVLNGKLHPAHND